MDQSSEGSRLELYMKKIRIVDFSDMMSRLIQGKSVYASIDGQLRRVYREDIERWYGCGSYPVWHHRLNVWDHTATYFTNINSLFFVAHEDSICYFDHMKLS